jgi:hypothetical protein
MTDWRDKLTAAMADVDTASGRLRVHTVITEIDTAIESMKNSRGAEGLEETGRASERK